MVLWVRGVGKEGPGQSPGIFFLCRQDRPKQARTLDVGPVRRSGQLGRKCGWGGQGDLQGLDSGERCGKYGWVG